MREKIIKIVFVIIAFGLFVTVIVLTNDNVKTMINAEKTIPIIIALIFLISIILQYFKKHGNT